MDRLDTHNTVLWYMGQLNTGPDEAALTELSNDDLRSYLSDLKRWYDDCHPTEAEAWDRA